MIDERGQRQDGSYLSFSSVDFQWTLGRGGILGKQPWLVNQHPFDEIKKEKKHSWMPYFGCGKEAGGLCSMHTFILHYSHPQPPALFLLALPCLVLAWANGHRMSVGKAALLAQASFSLLVFLFLLVAVVLHTMMLHH